MPRHAPRSTWAAALVVALAAASLADAQRPSAPVTPRRAAPPARADRANEPAEIVRAFYRATAREAWSDAAAVFHQGSMERFRERALLYLLSWAVGRDTMPPRPGALPSRSFVPPRWLTALDTALLARHADAPLPRWAPAATLGVFARMPARDVVERLLTLKWSRYPVRAMPKIRGVTYEGDSVAHVLAWWPADSAPDDPYRSTVFHLRRERRRWRLDAGPPLLQPSDLATYAVPRPDLSPLPPPGTVTTFVGGTPGQIALRSVTRGGAALDPALMTREDSLAWSRSARALARTDTITVLRTEITLSMGDSLALQELGAVARDSAGQPVVGFVPAWRMRTRSVARLARGYVVATAPGLDTLLVQGIRPSARPGFPPEHPPRPRTAVVVRVQPAARAAAPTPPTGTIARASATWIATGGAGFRVATWIAPGSPVPGDTLYVRAVALHIGDRPTEVFARSCGGVRMVPSPGLTFRESAGMSPCPLVRQTMMPGDSIVGEAWGVVDGAPGRHDLTWWVASRDTGSRSGTSVNIEAAGTHVPRSFVPSRALAPATDTADARVPPRRVPYVLRLSLSPRSSQGVTSHDVWAAVDVTTAGLSGIDVYRVSEAAMARTIDLPHVVISVTVSDTGSHHVEMGLLRRIRVSEGVTRDAMSCGGSFGGSGTGAIRSFGTSLTVRLALELRELLQDIAAGGC